MSGFSIKQLEILSGIKAHTIRIWEQRYNLLNPSRSDTNIRFYSIDELKILLHISLLNSYGYKISKIDKMTLQELEEVVVELSKTKADKEFTVNQLFIHLFSMNIDAFEKTLDDYIKKDGMADAMENVVDSFLQKVSLLQAETGFSIVYEQLMSNVIRQKLIVAIDHENLVYSNRKIISFLPEEHYYEIDLLYMQYLLKKEGLNVVYLGANVPVKDVRAIIKANNAKFVHTHLSCLAQRFNTQKFLDKLSTSFYQTTVIVTGNYLKNYKKSVPANVHLKPSLQDAIDFIA